MPNNRDEIDTGLDRLQAAVPELVSDEDTPLDYLDFQQKRKLLSTPLATMTAPTFELK